MSVTNLPNKSRPTNADLQDQLREVHACVHTVAESVQTVANQVKEDRHHAAQAMSKFQAQYHLDRKADGERIAKTEGMLEAISITLGMNSADDGTPKPVKRFGSQSPFTVICQMFGATSGALLLMKTVGPSLQAFVASLWSALTHS